MALAAGADGELPDAVRRVGDGRRGQGRARLHRGRPLVDVVVAVEQDVDAGRVEVVPQRLERLGSSWCPSCSAACATGR